MKFQCCIILLLDLLYNLKDKSLNYKSSADFLSKNHFFYSKNVAEKSYNIVNVCVYNSAVYFVHCSEKALRIRKNDNEFVKAPSVESSSADLKANTHTTPNHGARPTTHIFKNLHSRVENYPPFSLCILFTQCDL